MRWLLLVALVAGCGDINTAGGIGTGGSSAGTSGQAGAAGDGPGGGAGTMAMAGSGGTVDAGLSCAIPMDQVSGTDSMATVNRSASGCPNLTMSVQIVNGSYWDSSWTLDSYSTSLSHTPGFCMAVFSYTRKSTLTCGKATAGDETLYAFLTVPGV